MKLNNIKDNHDLGVVAGLSIVTTSCIHEGCTGFVFTSRVAAVIGARILC